MTQKNPDSEPEFILASTSPRRQLLLRSFLSKEFLVKTPDFEELKYHLCPSIIPVINAEGKGRSVSKLYPQSWVISADTVIEYEGKIIGKPRSMDDAEKMLAKFAGRSHFVITAVMIAREESATYCLFADLTTVFFKEIGICEIRKYLSLVNPLDKAGAYSIEEEGDIIIDRIIGSRWNVAGLPLEKLAKAFYSLELGNSIRNLVPEPFAF